MTPVSLAITFALGIACGRTPAQPGAQLPASLTLGVGQTARAGGLGVTFVGVSNDWRCPIDAFCITAGDAYLQLRLSAALTETRQFQVEHPDNRHTSFDGYTIEVQRLEPFPSGGRPVRPDEYVVTVGVSR